MRVAQRLYENGYITYMRTDSTKLSETALAAARQQARELYGDAYVPPRPRRYTRKVKNAQEAHEAIRPSGDAFRTPGAARRELSSEEFRLYELIWQRTLASQMADAVGQTVEIRLAGRSITDEGVEFAARPHDHLPRVPPGLRGERDESAATVDDEPRRTTPSAECRGWSAGSSSTPRELDARVTRPRRRPATPSQPGRPLEELGIGRPSTYASILQTIQDRGYVWKKGSALVPSWIAFAVVSLLEQHFARLVDYEFTAALEKDLDSIANGSMQRVDWLTGSTSAARAGGSGGSPRPAG